MNKITNWRHISEAEVYILESLCAVVNIRGKFSNIFILPGLNDVSIQNKFQRNHSAIKLRICLHNNYEVKLPAEWS